MKLKTELSGYHSPECKVIFTMLSGILCLSRTDGSTEDIGDLEELWGDSGL